MRATTLIIVTCGLFLGCIQKSLLTTEIGTITGRIRPAGANALIYLEGTDDSTRCGDDGFFIMPSVPHGDYNLIVEAEGYSHRERHHVVVVQAQLTSVGIIQLTTLPYPVYATSPSDGETDVPINYYIYVATDDRLDLTTLRAFAHFEPPLSGEWQEPEAFASNFSYVFTLAQEDSRFHIATTYHVIIPTEVRTKDGQPLEHPISVQFTTVPLTISVNVEGQKYVRLSDFGVVAYTNAPVNIDSLNKAFVIEPSIEARWFASPNSQYGDPPRLVLPVGVRARPDTWYTIVINDKIALSDSLKLREPYVALFKTTGFGVASVFPAFNGYMIHDDTVQIALNLPADTASVENAISVAPHDGISIPISIAWSSDRTTMRISPPAGWEARTPYALTISPGARSEEGATLASEYVSYFFAF